MNLPTGATSIVVLSIGMLVFWGLWANTLKMAAGRRFELYHIDFICGVLLTAVAVTFTLGTLGDDITTLDNLALVGNKEMAFSVAAGFALGLGTLLLVAAISVAGMTIAFPIAGGVSAGVSAVASLLGKTTPFVSAIAGATPMLLAAAAAMLAFCHHVKTLPPVEPAPRPAGRGRLPQPKRHRPWKGILMAVSAGLMIGPWSWLVAKSRVGTIELEGYGIALLVAGGLFASSLFFSIWFLNLPVEGAPLGFPDWVRGGRRSHLLGIFGGMLWQAGLTCALLAAGAAPTGRPITAALARGAFVVSALCGWLVWKELRAARPARLFFLTAILLALIGSVVPPVLDH